MTIKGVLRGDLRTSWKMIITSMLVLGQKQLQLNRAHHLSASSSVIPPLITTIEMVVATAISFNRDPSHPKCITMVQAIVGLVRGKLQLNKQVITLDLKPRPTPRQAVNITIEITNNKCNYSNSKSSSSISIARISPPFQTC